MTGIRFYKMEGAGNDFVVIDNRNTQFSLDEIIEFTPKLCDRKFGVGADGLLVLENPQLDNIDYTMIYRNADGSDAGMCGNGSRCLALFAATHGFDTTQSFNVHQSIYSAEVNLKNNSVSISFPDVDTPKKIHIDEQELIQVYTGTEHVVQFVDEKHLEKETELVKSGSKIRYNQLLNPPGSNVNFVCDRGNQSLNLQTYEKGVEGLTLACGTGAIASAVAAHFNTDKKSEKFEYSIHVKGGTLKVSFTFNQHKNMYQNIKLIGPAAFVFEGKINV
tara:strand:+ start:18405 stop:19232 length:828 start_codon:yes stop_codon:yes gene_type:complete